MDNREQFISSMSYWYERLLRQECAAFGTCLLKSVDVSYIVDPTDPDRFALVCKTKCENPCLMEGDPVVTLTADRAVAFAAHQAHVELDTI